MSKEYLLPYERNIALKKSFAEYLLDPSVIMEMTPHDLNLENSRLENLLKLVCLFYECGSNQEKMAEQLEPGFVPPVNPPIDPESDWLRFILWSEGSEIYLPMPDYLYGDIDFVDTDSLTDEEVEALLPEMIELLEESGFHLHIPPGVPARVIYFYISELYKEKFPITHHDPNFQITVCNDLCPQCAQRPWCELGQQFCWQEDEAAGKMVLPPELDNYVSASPQSLFLLQLSSAMSDEKYEKEMIAPRPGEEPDQRLARLN